MTQNVMSINDLDVQLLSDFIRANFIETILEFGSGYSTKIFSDLGVKVVTFDTEAKYLNTARQLQNVTGHIWKGVADDFMVKYCKNFKADMVFIDGPAGGENREAAYHLATLIDARFIACHDIDRDFDKRLVNKYMRNYSLKTYNDKTEIYLTKQIEAKVLIGMPICTDYRIDYESTKFCMSSMRKGWHYLNCPSVEPSLARNMILTWFLCNEEFKDYTHVFFIDADTVPPPQTIEKLLAHNLDVVAGVTPIWANKNLYWNFQYVDEQHYIFVTDPNLPKPKGLLEVSKVGGTTILMKRKVIEALDYPFYEIETPKTLEQAMKTGPMIQGSDYHVCDMIRNAGFKIFVDTRLECKHMKKLNLMDLVKITFQK